MRKRIAVIIGTVLLVGAIVTGTGLALTMFQETLAGLGSAAFTNEVEVIKVKVKGLNEVRVRLGTTVNTVADRIYDVELYGDDELLGTQTVTWTAPEIASAVQKDVALVGLPLAGVVDLDVDVVY